MGTSKFVASWSEAWVAWGPLSLWLLSEVKAVLWGPCPQPVKFGLSRYLVSELLTQRPFCTSPASRPLHRLLPLLEHFTPGGAWHHLHPLQVWAQMSTQWEIPQKCNFLPWYFSSLSLLFLLIITSHLITYDIIYLFFSVYCCYSLLEYPCGKEILPVLITVLSQCLKQCLVSSMCSRNICSVNK